MQIRNYARSDAPAIVRLFYETIHVINSRDYSAEQLHAWAPEVPSVATWHTRMVQRHTLVAEETGEMAAFAELEADGHVDMFYCYKDATGRGVGRQLYQAIEQKAQELGRSRLFAEVSIVKAVGPLASFKGVDSWVEDPYENGIALIGDAAATSVETSADSNSARGPCSERCLAHGL